MTGAVRPPEAYLRGLGGPSVEVPITTAAWLAAQPELVRLRRRAVGRPEVCAVLEAIVAGGKVHEYREARRKQQGKSTEAPGQLVVMSAKEAAESLGITSHAVRIAINKKRLPATRNGAGRWQVLAEHVEDYRSNRRRAA